MEKLLIAKDILNKFLKYELAKNKYNNNYTKSTQSKNSYTNWQKAKGDGMEMKDVLTRNLFMWSEYAYNDMTYMEIANKFDLSYEWTIGIVKKTDKSIKLFMNKMEAA
tara:strand:+ start:278 stop:601 length:324 start_codon:yes stop_codon:yes gene_type:complete